MDFDVLGSMIEDACRKSFSALRVRYPREDFCGYALFSDAGAMSVSLALNSKSHLEKAIRADPGDAAYYKWSPGEWAHEAEGAEHFQDISRLLRREALETKTGEQFSEFRDRVYEVCVRALEKLSADGFISVGNDCVLVFTVSDADELEREVDWVRRLNGEQGAREFADRVQEVLKTAE